MPENSPQRYFSDVSDEERESFDRIERLISSACGACIPRIRGYKAGTEPPTKLIGELGFSSMILAGVRDELTKSYTSRQSTPAD